MNSIRLLLVDDQDIVRAGLRSLLEEHPNLILTGNAYKGVALNDCVANAYRIADSLSS